MSHEKRKAPILPDRGPLKSNNLSECTRSGPSRKPAFARIDDAIAWVLKTGVQLVSAPAVQSAEAARPISWVLPVLGGVR